MPQQETRRAWRTGVYVVSTMVYLAFIGWIIHKADMTTLQLVASGLLAILFIFAVGYVAENVTARIKIQFPGGASADIDPEDKPDGNPQ